MQPWQSNGKLYEFEDPNSFLSFLLFCSVLLCFALDYRVINI